MALSRPRRDDLLVRRSRWATCYWAEDGCHLSDPVEQSDVPGDATDVRLLAAADDWCDVADLATQTALAPSEVRSRMVRLLRAGLFERGDRPMSAARRRASGWTHWGVTALAFHAASRDVSWAGADEVAGVVEDRAIEHSSHPAPAVPRRGGRDLPVPPADAGDPVVETLRARRTWRRFGGGAVPLAEFSTLLHVSFGVQGWMQGRVGGPYALKTSPSGGACHPLEAYVVVRRVVGVEPGIYHYDADGHALHRLSRRGTGDLRRWFPGQAAHPAAAVVCVLVARFERLQWKYHTPRAYRVVLLDAGHVGQTFCLMATRLGLAPCCTGAFDDRVVERALGVDGLERAAIYAMGVGVRPAGTDWAPFADAGDIPVVSRPASARRRSVSGVHGAGAAGGPGRAKKRSGQ